MTESSRDTPPQANSGRCEPHADAAPMYSSIPSSSNAPLKGTLHRCLGVSDQLQCNDYAYAARGSPFEIISATPTDRDCLQMRDRLQIPSAPFADIDQMGRTDHGMTIARLPKPRLSPDSGAPMPSPHTRSPASLPVHVVYRQDRKRRSGLIRDIGPIHKEAAPFLKC